MNLVNDIYKPYLFDSENYLIMWDSSGMINNNVKCVVSTEDVVINILDGLKSQGLGGLYVYFIRPVHEKEKVPFGEFYENDVDCPYFRTMNAMHSLLVPYRINKLLGIDSFEKVIASAIGTEFCDCMSGGMDSYKIMVLRHLIRALDTPLNKEVYHNFTIGNFLKETNGGAEISMDEMPKLTNFINTN